MNKSEIKLLVVDDEETLREGLRTYLEQEGYRVDAAISAEEALAYDLAGYDLLLLDIMMDGMSGTELAARRSSACTKAKRLHRCATASLFGGIDGAMRI